MDNITFIIQARTNSSRLPNKVILPFFEDKCILEIIINNLQINFPNHKIVIATTLNQSDDKIVDLANSLNVFCYRGSETNVLKRFVEAAKEFNAHHIVRVCADNPFLHMDFIKKLIDIFHQNPNFDYYSFKNFEGTPVIKTHFGLFVELVKLSALEKTLKLTNEDVFLEHVTNYIYSNETFDIYLEELPEFLYFRKDLRFTIDDEVDFESLKEIYKIYQNQNFDLNKMITFIDSNIELKEKMIKNIKKYSK